MYGFGNSGATPGGRFGGALPARNRTQLVNTTTHRIKSFRCRTPPGGAVPDDAAMEFRVEGAMVELVLRPRPRLLTLRTEETGAALATALGTAE